MTRRWTPDEIDLLAYAWWPRTLWYHLPARVYVGGPARVEFDQENPVVTRRIYLPEDAPASAKVHEVGHALHLSIYPESAYWSTFKCEVFAMLGIVNARMEAVYGPLPEVVAAQAIVATHPLRYDLAMKMAAELPEDGDG